MVTNVCFTVRLDLGMVRGTDVLRTGTPKQALSARRKVDM